MPSQADAKTLFQNNLAALGYGAGSPAVAIVEMPGQELWRSAMTDSALMKALCQNFYAYSRTHGWQWVSGSGAIGDGAPLLQGAMTSTNCGGFNRAVNKMAKDVLGINAVTNANTADTFITKPGTVVLDAHWTGNVRTLSQNFDQLRAFFFTGHSWNRVGGDHYDPTTNTFPFNGATDLYWCKLAKLPGAGTGAWGVTVTGAPQPFGPPPYVCIRAETIKQNRQHLPIVATTYPGGVALTQSFANSLPVQVGLWTSLLLVSRAHLSPEFRKAINYP